MTGQPPGGSGEQRAEEVQELFSLGGSFTCHVIGPFEGYSIFFFLSVCKLVQPSPQFSFIAFGTFYTEIPKSAAHTAPSSSSSFPHLCTATALFSG